MTHAQEGPSFSELAAQPQRTEPLSISELSEQLRRSRHHSLIAQIRNIGALGTISYIESSDALEIVEELLSAAGVYRAKIHIATEGDWGAIGTQIQEPTK